MAKILCLLGTSGIRPPGTLNRLGRCLAPVKQKPRRSTHLDYSEWIHQKGVFFALPGPILGKSAREIAGMAFFSQLCNPKVTFVFSPESRSTTFSIYSICKGMTPPSIQTPQQKQSAWESSSTPYNPGKEEGRGGDRNEAEKRWLSLVEDPTCG